MNFPTAVKICFQKYATFSGRASRSEYWWFYLFAFLLSVPLALVDSIVGNASTMPLNGLYWLVFLPYWSVTIRRLHDVNWSGTAGYIGYAGFLVLTLGQLFFLSDDAGTDAADTTVNVVLLLFIMIAVVVFLVVWLVLFVLSLKKGTAGENRFGSDPLAGAA